MLDTGDIMLVTAGVIAIMLALISGWRLVQRLQTKRYWSAGGFAARLALSTYIIYVFFRLALF